MLDGSADNEPTKDWIRISVSTLHGKVERPHNQFPVMVPCDYRDVERAQPVVDLCACDGSDRSDQLRTTPIAPIRGFVAQRSAL
jgi:hypothetical protein